jgi:hypothetical protein
VKTPASLLLVENQRWYPNLAPFTQTLETLGIPYDIFSTQSQPGFSLPTMDDLRSYPTIFWATGYNWYDPLGTDGGKRLGDYLDQGGRLLITSQDLLDFRDLAPFARDRLGVLHATLAVTPTQVTGEFAAPFWENLGPWELDFPYTNWGDSLQPTISATVILRDQNYHPIGVIRPDLDWRTAFTSFPLETMTPAANLDLESRLLLWLSTFGESHLEAPPAASAGTQVPISFTLGLAKSQAMPWAKVLLPLPVGITLATQTPPSLWSYDPLLKALVWTGAIQPGKHLEMSAWLELDDQLPAGTSLPLRAYLYDPKGLVTVAYTPILVNLPWLRLVAQATPSQAVIQETSHFSLTLSNAGVLTSNPTLTITIPSGLDILHHTLQYNTGNLAWISPTLVWQGDLGAPGLLTLEFDVAIGIERGGRILLAPIDVRDQFSYRKAWFPVLVLDRHFMPVIKLSNYP